MDQSAGISNFNEPQEEIFYFSSLKNRANSIKDNVKLCRKQFISKISLYQPITSSPYKVSEYPYKYSQSSKFRSGKALERNSHSPPMRPTTHHGKNSKILAPSKIFTLRNCSHHIINKAIHEAGCSCCNHKATTEGSYESLLQNTRLHTSRVQSEYKTHFLDKNLKRNASSKRRTFTDRNPASSSPSRR